LWLERETPEGKVRQNWTTFSSPGFGIANFSFLAGKTSYLLITKLGLLTIKMLVLPRLSNFVQFHWTPWSGDPRVNIENKKGKAKSYQVRQVLAAINKLEGMDNG
jgi:hypothetical protein